MALIAVTGGSGYLGAAVVDALSSIEGARLRLLARSQVDLSHHEVVPGDVTDPEACRRLVMGADAVVHAAGLVRSTDEAALEFVNVQGTRFLVQAARDASARFVHVSSTGVYGHPGGEVDESSPLRPSNPYERSKARSEVVVEEVWASGAILIRPSNVIGVGHPLRPLRRFLRRVREGRRIVHAGAWANYVSVTDVARVIAAATTVADVPPALIVNVPRPMETFVQEVGLAVRRDGRTLALPAAVGHVGRPVVGLLSNRTLSLERVRALLDGTRYRTGYQDWFDRNGLSLTLEPVLTDLAVEYDIGGDT